MYLFIGAHQADGTCCSQVKTKIGPDGSRASCAQTRERVVRDPRPTSKPRGIPRKSVVKRSNRVRQMYLTPSNDCFGMPRVKITFCVACNLTFLPRECRDRHICSIRSRRLRTNLPVSGEFSFPGPLVERTVFRWERLALTQSNIFENGSTGIRHGADGHG